MLIIFKKMHFLLPVFLIFVFNRSIGLAAKVTCEGEDDVNTQFQKAVEYTKTEEFYEMFLKFRNTTEWQKCAIYMSEYFKIDAEELLFKADPRDTITSFQEDLQDHIPLVVKMRFLIMPDSLNMERALDLYNELVAVPEFQTLVENLCNQNVSLDEIADAFGNK